MASRTLVPKPRVRPRHVVVIHGIGLEISCLIAFWVSTRLLGEFRFISRDDDSMVAVGGAGHMLAFADPDGTFLRVLEMPEGGIENVTMREGDPEGPWINPPSMQHPHNRRSTDERPT